MWYTINLTSNEINTFVLFIHYMKIHYIIYSYFKTVSECMFNYLFCNLSLDEKSSLPDFTIWNALIFIGFPPIDVVMKGVFDELVKCVAKGTKPVVCLLVNGTTVEEEEVVGERRGIPARDVSCPGGINLIGDWIGFGWTTLLPVAGEVLTSRGGGAKSIVFLSESEESEDPLPDSLLLSLEEDPLLLEELLLFLLPFPPIAMGLPAARRPIPPWLGIVWVISLVSCLWCDVVMFVIGKETINVAKDWCGFVVIAILLAFFTVLVAIVCLFDPLTVCFFEAPLEGAVFVTGCLWVVVLLVPAEVDNFEAIVLVKDENARKIIHIIKMTRG